MLLPCIIVATCTFIAALILRHSMKMAQPRREAKGIATALRRWKASLAPEPSQAPRKFIRR